MFRTFGVRICPVDTDGKGSNSEQYILRELHDGTDLQGTLTHQRSRRNDRTSRINTASEPCACNLLRHPHPCCDIGHKNQDRKSTRLNSSPVTTSYAVSCLT